MNPEDRFAVCDGDPYEATNVEFFTRGDRAADYADRAGPVDPATGKPRPLDIYICRPVSEAARWAWGVRSADGEVMEYVNENAARNSVHGTHTLAKARRGDPNGPWQDAE